MSEFKGTKTEWELLKGTSLLGVQIGKTIFGISNITEETKANALLISKAPEMLEMLEKCFNMCDKLQFPTEQELNTMKSEIKKLIKESTEL